MRKRITTLMGSDCGPLTALIVNLLIAFALYAIARL